MDQRLEVRYLAMVAGALIVHYGFKNDYDFARALALLGAGWR